MWCHWTFEWLTNDWKHKTKSRFRYGGGKRDSHGEYNLHMISLVPRLPPFFVLRFSLSIIHAWERSSFTAFMIEVWWNFDKMQIIFKAVTGSSGRAPWWEGKCGTVRSRDAKRGALCSQHFEYGIMVMCFLCHAHWLPCAFLCHAHWFACAIHIRGRGALGSQHFEYGSNYGHVFPVSRPLARMRFSVSRSLIPAHARYTLGVIACMVFRSCSWCNG